MTAKNSATQTLDDLRAEAQALLVASGLKPERATRLAGLLLWSDASGLPDRGIATLPGLLDAIARGELDPRAEPVIRPEKAASAVIAARRAPAPLALARAAEVASEKAREYGSCVVRVTGIGPIRSALAVVAEVAVGPFVASAFGPGGAWSVAMPSVGGMPLLADASLGDGASAAVPWAPLIGPGEWIVQVTTIPTLEPVSSFQERVDEFCKTAPASFLRPDRLEEVRRESRERGVKVDAATRSALKAWRGKLIR